MNMIITIGFAMRRMLLVGLLLIGMFVVSCSSAPEPQPEPSKKEVQQDSERFFEKMKKEEPTSPHSE